MGRTVRKVLVAPVLLAALALGACSDGGGEGASSSASDSAESGEPGTGRPSVEELTGWFVEQSEATGQEVTVERAECVAEGLVDSELSDELLRAFANMDETYVPTEDEQAQLFTVTSAVSQECGIRDAEEG